MTNDLVVKIKINPNFATSLFYQNGDHNKFPPIEHEQRLKHIE